MLVCTLGWTAQGASGDWGVTQSGAPGIYSWQHLYNWNIPGQHISPSAIPNAIGDVASLNLINIVGRQTINLNGAVTLGTLNIGDTNGTDSFIIAAGTGGSLTMNNGGTAAINKTGLATDVISSGMVLTNPVTIDIDDGRLFLSGIISGAGGITKNGSGTLLLGGANTFTGVMTLNDGITLAFPQGNNLNVWGASGAGQGTVVNAGATFASGGDYSGNAGVETTEGWGASGTEPLTINGNGYLGQGAIRKMFGREQDTLGGAVTLGSASRIQTDSGTLALTGPIDVNQALTISGASGTVLLNGTMSGASTITHYGVSALQLSNVSAGQTYSGTINSNLGEIRSNTGVATANLNPYQDITALNLRNSALRLNFGNGAGTPNDGPNSRFSPTAPLSMRASQINIDNASFNATAANLFDYAVAQTFGATTLESGGNKVSVRSADAGSITITFTNLLKPNAGTMLELQIDNLSGGATAEWGASAKHRIVNSALEAGPTTVPFVGGWAFYDREFLEYDPVATGGHGYSKLDTVDQAVDTAEGSWGAGQNLRLTSGNFNITANRTVQSLNMRSTTARTLSGNAGTVLEVQAGGILTSDATHIISVPFLTAGAAGDYQLYDIAWSENIIRSVIQDNGANPVSLVKAGSSTSRFWGANTNTGTTYLVDGMFQDIIGARNITALGTGNLNMVGDADSQAAYETDRNFVRALGTGVGEVQLTGGGGFGSGSVGFSAMGAPIDINFGGAGGTVTWGSATFNPGIFTLNGGNATHAVTLAHDLDLGGEQRYIRLDGNASAGMRGVMGTISGDITNGGVVKRGGGMLFFDDAKSYSGGTNIGDGELWLRNGTGTAGTNVNGNDIFVGGSGRLKIDDPASIGSRQMMVLQNGDDNNASAITFGRGYGDGSAIRIHSIINSLSGTVPQTGPYDVMLVNQQRGNDRRNRVGIQISGISDFSTNLMAQVKAVAPDVEAWFGADTGNGIYTGTTLTPTGRTKTGSFEAFRLGSGGGTITITGTSVLNAAVPLVVGHDDQNGRVNIGGVVYLPNAQNYSGTITQTVGNALTAGNLIGAGGVLVVGSSSALNTANNNISLRAGEIRFGINSSNSFLGGTDTQYESRNIFVKGGSSTIRTIPISGAGNSTLTLGTFLMRMDDADRSLSLNSIGTTYMTTVFKGAVTLENGNTDARSAFFDVGNDNSFQSGLGILVFEGVVSQTGSAAVTVQKRNGGVLILKNDNTYLGTTNVQQGRLVVAHTGAAGVASSTINMNTNNDRRSDLEFRFDGVGPFVVNNTVSTSGGNDGSTRVITVGSYDGSSSNQQVELASLVSNAGGATTTGNSASAIYFDGFNGYSLKVTGATTLTRTLTDFRTRGAVVTLAGAVGGAGALNKYDQGTLVLSGNNNFTGGTNMYNGYLVLGHDNAFGGGSLATTFNGGAFSQVLASGARTITRNFTNNATGSTQTIGGLDAGVKVFSGNISLASRGINLTSAAGGDTTFSGIISGTSQGINKVGLGAVILAPAAGTGNTYTGATTVTNGSLVGLAQTSGSPFGVNSAITIANGTLELRNNLGVANATTTTGALTVGSGGANLVIDATGAGGNATSMTFGSLARTGNGSLVLSGVTTDLGTAGNERVSLTSAPSLTAGLIGAWAAIENTGAAHYATVSGGNVVTASYTGSGVALDTAAGVSNVLDVVTGTLTADRTAFAFRTAAGASQDLDGFTLNLGNAAASTLGQAGIMLNGGADVTNGSIDFGTNVLSVYTAPATTSTLSADLTNYRNNANNTLATVFIKFGGGTLELDGSNTFEGNIQINQGNLSLIAPNALPMFGNLNAVTGTVVTIQPGGTVTLNNNDQEFGNLAGSVVVSPVQNTAGVLDLGTATLAVGRQGSSFTYSGQIIGGTGSTIQKFGGGRLTLDNFDTSRANSLDTLEIYQGQVSSLANDQSWGVPNGFANTIPGTTEVILKGGEWEIRTMGDSTSNFQLIPLGNNITQVGADSILDTDRAQNGSNKIISLGSLTLDKQRFLVTGGNAVYPRFEGAVTLTSNSRIQTDAPLLLNGTISGNFTLTKTGTSNLEINSDNSTWSGGTVATDGTILFGTRTPESTERYMAGTNVFSYSSSANLGTGDIVINRGTAIRINTPDNILSGDGQRVQLFGSIGTSLPRVDIGLNAPLTDYNLRSTTNGALTIGLRDGFYTYAIDQAMLGNGKWGLSAWETTYYTASTLGAGVDNTYRFFGTNGVFGITTGGAVSGTASVQVGVPSYDQGFAVTSGNGQVRFYGDQTYTGNTTIFRNRENGSTQNFLDISGDSASPIFDVYGRLMARGAGRFTNDAGAQVNTVNLYPGSVLRLDYNMDVNDTMLISRLENSNLGLSSTENKWADGTGLMLDGATVNLINHSGRVNQERVGQITVKNGAAVLLERNGTNGQIVLSTPGITRTGQATFAVRENANELGRVDIQGMKFFIDNGGTMLDAQGMMPAWMVNPARNTFLTYNSDFGVQNIAFTNSTTTAGTGATFLTGLTATSIADYGVGVGDPTLSGTANVWALRIAHEASGNDTTLTGGQINIHSGGLIVDNRDNARVNFNTTNVYFGNGSTAVEGIVYSDHSNVTTRMGGIVTAAGLTMHGAGNIQLTNAANVITGNIQMNSGKLFLDGPGTASTATITMAGDWLGNNDGQQMAELWLRTADADATFNNPIIVAQNTPYVRVMSEIFNGASTTTTTRTVTIPSLNILGTSSLNGTNFIFGTTSNTNNANNYNLTVSGATTLGGTAPIGIRVERGGTNVQGGSGVLRFQGSVTGSAPLIKSGDGVLRFDSSNTNLTGGITLNRGEIRAFGNSANMFGTGDITAYFGTLRMSQDGGTAHFNAPNQDLFLVGPVSLTSDRPSATNNAANMTIGTNNGTNTFRSMNGAHIRFQADSFGDDYYLESKIFVNDSAVWYNDNSEIFIRETLSGNGRLTKSGIWYTYFDNAAANPDWGGVLDIQAGTIRIMNDTATLGGVGSSIIVQPAGALAVRSVANLGTGLGITELRTTSSMSFPVLGINLTANFASLLAHFDGLTATGNRNGVLAIGGGQTITVDPAMASFQNGNWFLGGTSGDGTFNANSIAPWGSTSNQFLLGGGGSTITFNPTTANAAQFAGAGNQMIVGAQHVNFGHSTTVIGSNANNTYGGGTFVSRTRNMDGTYRGSALSIQGGQTAAATFRTPLGTGAVDVFGEIRLEGGAGTARNAASTNANIWTFHPGSRIRFDNGTPFAVATTEGRWADAVAMTLNGAVLELYGDDAASAYNTETIGALTVERGAEVVVRRRGAFLAEIIAGNLTRTGDATLMITGMDTNSNTSTGLGVTGSVSAMRFLVANGASFMNNNMVDPWIIGRVGGTFLRYDAALGFQPLTTANTPNYIVSTAATIDGTVAPLNDGTEILSLESTGTITLAKNLDVYALRVSRQINASINQGADGASTMITIRSGGLSFAQTGGTNRNPTIHADISFGLNGSSDAFVYNDNDVVGQLNGKIFAQDFIKSGQGETYIRSDQPQFTGDWIINGGALRFLTPGAPSTGEVILNGSRMNDRDNTYNLSEVRYQFDSGSPDLFTWNGGDITAYDNNRIYAITATDRLQQFPNINLHTTNAVAGIGQEGVLLFQVDGFRTTVRTGTVTLHDHYLIHVESGTFGTGSTTGIQLGSGSGVGGLDNQGLYDFRKVGDGVLTLGDISTTFTGGRSITIGEGAVRVTSNGSFGPIGSTANIEQGGALEIALSGWSPSATLVQQPGSFERWAVNGARSGTVTLPAGVHLQIMQNQTGTQTVNLNGGSIMGYLPRDWEQVGVIHRLGSGITVNLTANSFLGQPFASSSNGFYDVHRLYDIGKINQTSGANLTDNALRGSYLQIMGAITGNGGITKIGQDIILLGGANTYSGSTTIENGILQIGRNNSLPIGTSLIMETSSAMFDLNGYHQEVASLSGDGGSINNGGFALNNFTINQSANTTYRGTVDGNITLVKQGGGTLTFTPVAPNGSATNGNGYRGGTILQGGKLSVAQDNALGHLPLVADADNVRFAGGTLLTTSSFTIGSNRGITLDSAGGTVETSTGVTTTVASVVTGIGSLSKTGVGVLQLNNAANNYTGLTNIVEGTLQAGAVDAFAPTSRHAITGDTVSGTLALNGFDQTIGSLSSTGATPANATVALGTAGVLTVGGDRSQDAVYAGAITGGASSVFRVNGGGAVQTLASFNNSAQAWNTQIANGILNVAAGAALGSGSVTLGIVGVSGADDFTGLNLQNTPTFANNIIVTNANLVGSAAITSSGSSAAITGTLTVNRDLFVGASSGTQLSLQNTVSGNGRLTVINGGSLRLTTANTYAPTNGVAGTSGSPMIGGTVVRAGSVLLENDTAAGLSAVNLGDSISSIAAVDRASFTTVGGTWNPNGGTNGFGSFSGVSSTFDGNTYTSGDVGTRLLITGEEGNPERNGIYTISSVSGGTMTLVRATDYETGNQMRYGGQVLVNNGTYSGQTMFQFEEQVVVRNEPTLEPVRFRQDVVNPNVSLLQNVSGLTVANNIVINATNGTGITTIGGSSAFTTGSGTFSGTVQLADVQAGIAETKTVQLTSSTSNGLGINFTGILSEVDTTPVTGDTMSVTKIGTGTVTMSGANTYRGTTSVTEGRLQVGNGGASGTGSILGSGAVTVTGAGTTLATAPILAGGSGNTVVAGAVSIGTATNPGILAPGIGDSATSNQSMTFSSTSGITVASGSQIQMSLTGSTLTISDAVVASWGATQLLTLNDYLTSNPGDAATFNVAPGVYGDLDYINITGGGLSLGSRASGTFGDGALYVQDNGASFAMGNVYNLFDWLMAMTGTFNTPGSHTTGGVYGDLDLPTLTGGLFWDVSALGSHGLIAIVNVPEPSRVLLMLFGFLAFFFRRRRG